MKVLFDNGVPRGLAAVLRQHAVEEARAHGWDALKNGDLLSAAEAAGFEVFVSTAVDGMVPGGFIEVEISPESHSPGSA